MSTMTRRPKPPARAEHPRCATCHRRDHFPGAWQGHAYLAPRDAAEMDMHDQARATRFTGTLHGPVFADRDGTCWRQVFEYEAGRCADAYVTRAGVQL